MLETTMQTIYQLPLISLMLVTLPIGALLIWLMPDSRKARWIALGAALVDLVLAVIILSGFDPGNLKFQYVEHISWIPTLNVFYHVGVDGFSVMFLPLTILLFIGAILASWNTSREMHRLYFSLLLLLESATLGVFCSLDTILFFLFWELTLIPIYFLISFWGLGTLRRYAAVKYTLYMMAGGMLLLLAFVVLAYNHSSTGNGEITFDYLKLLATPVSKDIQIAVFFLFLIGFAAKIPVFPFHTWLPTMAMHGPASVVALITGLKIGAFGLIRYLVPLAPEAARQFHWLLVALGVIGIIYGALIAMSQTNLRRMLAYSSISHVGLVIVGIASFNTQGIQGAVFQLLNFTVVSGGLFLLVGFLYQRIGSTDSVSLGGVITTMPRLTAFFLFLGLASMGMPGTNGFPAELLIFFSVLTTHTGAGLAALAGMILSAVYFLRLYRVSFLGPATATIVKQATDLKPREILVALVLSLVVLLMGIFPHKVLDTSKGAATVWVEQVGKKSR